MCRIVSRLLLNGGAELKTMESMVSMENPKAHPLCPERSTIEISRAGRREIKRLKNAENPDYRYEAYLLKVAREHKALSKVGGVEGLVRALRRLTTR